MGRLRFERASDEHVEHRQCVVLAPGSPCFRAGSLCCSAARGRSASGGELFRVGDLLLMSAARMALPAPGQRERDGLVVGVR